MIRRVLIMVFGLSLLLLCALTVALSVRSYHTTDTLRRAWPGRSLSIILTRGHAIAHEQVAPPIEVSDCTLYSSPTRRYDERCVRYSPVWSAAGISFEQHHGSGTFLGWRDRSLVIPYWLAFVVFGAAPLGGIARRLCRRTAPSGVCRSCGYDLRATPARCPECGTVPAD